MRNKILFITLFIQIICFIAVFGSFTKSEIVQARASFQEATPQPFLGAIYYGRRTVTNVFDHSFPGDTVKNDYVIHYDGTQHKLATNTPIAPDFTPVPGEWIRNGYGYNGHLGIDYNLMYRPVLAAATGIVEVANWSNPDNHRLGYGLHVVMSHPDGPNYETWYGHLSSLTVQTGDEINFGEWNDPADRRRIIGISGNTGRVIGLNDGGCPNVEEEHSCGYHLHFEVRLNGVDVNPYGWIAVGVDGTPAPDPWAPPIGAGAKSYNLWSTRPAIATRPATSPSQYSDGFILEEPDVPIPYIIVDNADENHYSQTPDDPHDPNDPDGPHGCMTEETGGYNGTFHRVQVIKNGAPTCTVRWTITPPDGITPNDDLYYELYVYIPETTLTLSRGAVYNISHIPEGGDQLQQNQAIAVQAVFPNVDYEANDNWVYLGKYHFALDGTEYIELNNVTFDGDSDALFIVADAIQLSAETIPPTNTSTPMATNTPTSTPTPVNTPTPLPPSAAYMTKISLGSGGQNPAISGNGQFLTYYSNSGDIMRYDHGSKQHEMVVDSSFGSDKRIAISDDGNYIAYVARGPYHDDVFLYDHNADSGELPQNLTNHAQGSTINFIQYWDIKIVQLENSVLIGYTERINFSGGYSQTIWLYDSVQGTPSAIDPGVGMARYLHDISADGDELLVRNEQVLYVYNRTTSARETVSLPYYLGLRGADFSSNGSYVVYNVYSNYCGPFGSCNYRRDVYWHDRDHATDDPEEISYDYGDNTTTVDRHPRVSDNGNYVFYMTNGFEIHRYDRTDSIEDQITLTIDGSNAPWGTVAGLEISSNGRFVTFSTTASNLVANDTNNAEDIFLADTALLTDPPTPTATPSNPNLTPTPTPKPKIICWFLTILASNDLGNSGIVRQDGINNSSAPASANESLFKQGRQFLGKMMQTADMLTLLYRLRDDVMSQTETGLYYTDLYYTHTEELTDIVDADSALFQEAHNTVLLFQPHLEDFLDGDGSSVMVTAAEVQAVQSLLDQFAAVGSPALQQTIADEQARAPLAQFIGKTSNEVWETVSPPPVATTTPTPTATSTPNGSSAVPIHINFQASSAPVPPGYWVDNGSVFANRSNGATYGWDIKITTTTRDRNNSLSPDQRYDTLVQPQDSNLPGDATWEMALPNGQYEIHFVAGDPAYFDSYYHVLAEGVTLINAAPTSGNRWLENTITVTVSDGRLSLTHGLNANNNKFNFIDITPVSGSTATPTATSISTATATNTATATVANTATPTTTSIATATGTPTPTIPASTSTPTPAATSTPGGTAAAPIHINFQANSAPVPPGYWVDNGSVFANRSNGATYGWDIKITTTTRDRNNSLSPDQRYDTLIQPQDSNLPSDATWEMALPNGQYEIHFVAGDPAYFDSYYHVLAEGVTLINAAPTNGNRWLENTITVTVSDGRLSLTHGLNANNNKYAFIDITPK